jgi:hypothetical protein
MATYEITFSEFKDGYALNITSTANDFSRKFIVKSGAHVANTPRTRRYFDAERIEEKGYLAAEVEAFKAQTGILQISRSLQELLDEVEALR